MTLDWFLSSPFILSWAHTWKFSGALAGITGSAWGTIWGARD